MNRLQHPSNNGVLGAPPGVPIDECVALPITRVVFADGAHGLAHYWAPTAKELELLNAGKPVRVIVLAVTHPPMSVGVEGDGTFADIDRP